MTVDPSATIHPTADIEADAAIGPGTAVWHRAQVRTGATIGADCIVGRDVFVDADVVIGDRVKIQNGALVYHGVTIESGVFVGPGAILTNDRRPRAITTSGDLARAEDWTVSPVVVRYGASIGAGAVVVAGTEIGRHAMVGAGAVVTRDVTPQALVVGNPARRLGWVCDCGARLMTPGGEPAPGQLPHYAMDRTLHCPTCARTYVYDPEMDRLADGVAAPTTRS